MQVPEMTVMTSPEHKEHYKRVDQGHHGMTMRHNQSYTAQPERKLNWLCNGRRKYVIEGERL